MLRKEDITTIFMDVDDTLLDFKECAREDVRNCCLKNGITYSDDLFEFFLRRNVILWKRIEDGLHTIWFNIRSVEASAQITPDHTITSLSELTSLL